MIKDDDNFDPFEFFDEEEAEAIDQKEKKKAQDEAPVGGSQVGEIKDPSVTVEEVSREDANFENDEKEQALAAKERHVLEQEAAAKWLQIKQRQSKQLQKRGLKSNWLPKRRQLPR